MPTLHKALDGAQVAQHRRFVALQMVSSFLRYVLVVRDVGNDPARRGETGGVADLALAVGVDADVTQSAQ